MKCAKCGKKTENLSFCRKCHSEMHPVIQSFKDIAVTLCSTCNSYFHKNKWLNYTDINDTIVKIAREKTIVTDITKLVHYAVVEDKYRRKRLEVSAGDEIYELPVNVIKTQCPVCSREKSKYFEATMQIREADESILSFIWNELDKQRKKGIFMTKEEPNAKGVDMFISSKKYAINLGNKLFETYGGILKINERLVTQHKQTSKLLYRVNVFFKPPHFLPGEIVVVNDEPVKITSTGKKISGKQLSDNKKVLFAYDEDEKILPKHETMVTKIHPCIEVLHPETFQSVETANMAVQKLVRDGDNVIVVVFNSKVFII